MIEYKTCTKCNKDYPKTKDYFFAKSIKNTLSSGKTKVYKSFRSICKKCHAKEVNQRRVNKRCKELNCKISDYQKKWKEKYSENRTVDLKAKELLSEGSYNNYLKLLKNNSIKDLKTYFKHIEKSKIERTQRIVKQVLSKQKYFTDDDKRKALRMYAKNEVDRLTDSYIANMLMKCKVSELTPEIIETKRNIIKLKRELKNNNLKIK